MERQRRISAVRRRHRRVNRADHYYRRRANVARDRVATPARVRLARGRRQHAALVNLITRESRAPLEGGHQPGAMRADCS